MVSVAFKPTPTMSNSGNCFCPEVFAELEALPLIRRADALAINSAGAFQQLLEEETRHHLAVLQNERNLVRAHFEYSAGAMNISRAVSKPRIKKTRIVDAEFANSGIEGNHLRRVIRRNPHLL